jgi:hypothetical protein
MQEPAAAWIGTDELGYTSAQLNARVMPVAEGAWWARVGDEWLSEYGGVIEFRSAYRAKEAVEQRRKEQRNA